MNFPPRFPFFNYIANDTNFYKNPRSNRGEHRKRREISFSRKRKPMHRRSSNVKAAFVCSICFDEWHKREPRNN